MLHACFFQRGHLDMPLIKPFSVSCLLAAMLYLCIYVHELSFVCVSVKARVNECAYMLAFWHMLMAVYERVGVLMCVIYECFYGFS